LFCNINFFHFSVAELLDFYAVPALACQNFQLQLRSFSPYILEIKIQKICMGFYKIFMFFRYINNHQKVLLGSVEDTEPVWWQLFAGAGAGTKKF
jgi:hypothetical protein